MAGENDRFVRWQKVTIDQLSYSTNLILTLAVATLAYALEFSKNNDFITAKPSQRCLGVLLLIGLLMLVLSVLLGLICTWNRLRDFRGTAQKAKDSPDAPSKQELDQMGERTWCLFRGQAWTFFLGVICVVIVIAVVRVPKLL